MIRVDTGRPPYQKGQTVAKAKRKPMKRVSDKRAARKASTEGQRGLVHMARVARLPCVICQQHGEHQTSPTQVHHAIHGRYSTDKAPDTSTLPLCEGHHLGDFDGSKLAIHSGKKTWAAKYGPDTDYLPIVADMLKGDHNEL